MPHIDFLLRVGLALLLGSAIGLERQWRQRVAGLRTNALVATGAALFVSLSALSGVDAPRMATYVVSGVGFLGAGAIMRQGFDVQGLNTAATLWCAAAVGVLSGAGFPWEATSGATLVVVAHLLLRPLGQQMARQAVETGAVEITYRVRIQCRSQDEQRIRAMLLQGVSQGSLRLQSLLSEDAEQMDRLEVRAEVISSGRADHLMEALVSRLSLDASVSAVSWDIQAVVGDLG
ncbi:MAG TPA: MgtC/SapB family protein [Holophagaceae bacterium]|jgi:putative Mg2+ transporter-C (MgtC) family protein|nr:MgtC/SapB family protein [Holophagaceae bacterium]